MELRTIVGMTFLVMAHVARAHGQDCEELKDGKFKVKFNKEYGGARYLLSLEGNVFTEVRNGQEVKGQIAINENCNLRLDYATQPESVNAENPLSKSSERYFEFERTLGKRLKFRLTGYGGPHTTAGEGQFVRIR